jgi:hypothetical protein
MALPTVVESVCERNRLMLNDTVSGFSYLLLMVLKMGVRLG